VKQVNQLLVVSRIVLAFLALACFGAYIVLPMALEGWRAFSLNLGTEITGILLTVWLIDAVIRGKEARDQERYRRIALQQLYVPLIRHLRLLSDMYKASMERKPDREISSLQDQKKVGVLVVSSSIFTLLVENISLLLLMASRMALGVMLYPCL